MKLILSANDKHQLILSSEELALLRDLVDSCAEDDFDTTEARIAYEALCQDLWA